MRIFQVLFVNIFCMLVIIGCASVRKQRGFNDVQNTVESRTGLGVYWNQGTPEDAAVQKTILSLLNNKLTADQALQIALLNNPSLQAKYEELGITQADLVQAGLPSNPSFAASFRVPDDDGKTNTEFRVEQNILDIVLLPLRKKVASERFEQTKLLVGDAVLKFAAEVRAEYYNLQGQQQMFSLQQRFVQAAEAAFDLAEVQYKAGNSSPLDLANHKVDFHEANLMLIQSEAELRADRERLRRMLSLSESHGNWQIRDELPKLPQTEVPLEGLDSLAVSNRLDLAAAQREVEVFKRALSLAKLGVIPSVSVGVETEREPDGARVTGPTLRLDIPLFDRGQAAKGRIEAQLSQSLKRLQAKEMDVRSEVRLLKGKLRVARKSVEYYRDNIIPIYQEKVELAQKEYNFMLRGVYHLIQDKQNEIKARLNYITALKDYWITRSELERAAGRKLHRNEGGK